MALKLSNNASSSLAASISDKETMVRVLAGHGARFPALNAGDWFPLAVQNMQGQIEYMRATARGGDVITVERAQENTAPRTFDAGDVVFLPLTTAAIYELQGNGTGVHVSVDDAKVIV